MGTSTDPKISRNQMVVERILNLIENGALKEGDRIPSIRQLSRELNVSINTVKDAYWKLESRNHIVAVPQSGFYVNKQPGSSFVQETEDPHNLDPQEVSICRIYGAFQNLGQCTPEISLAVSVLDPDLWPKAKLGRFFQQSLRDQEQESLNYLMTPGYIGLREQIARWGLSCGLDLSPDEIIITNGCHEAIFLTLMTLLEPGDTVAVESPFYFNLLQLLQQLKLKVIEVPSSDTEGINLGTLRFVLDNYDVKAVFSINNINNPMGFSMPQSNKRKLVALLAQRRIPLIEDDIYGDLGFRERAHPCKAYDSGGNVILCSSFSKTIAPGLRVGWVIPGKYFDQVAHAKTLFNISTASLNQIVLARFLKDGGYARYLRSLRKTLADQVAAMRAAILRNFPKSTRVTRPAGGSLLWIELPRGCNAESIYYQALKQNILIAPGHLFSVKSKYTNFMRLNAGMWNRRVEKAIQVIGALCRNELSAGTSERTTLKDAV